MLVEYIAHRKEVIRRRTQFDLRKAQERAHILEGLSIALDAIDRVIATIKKSKDKDDAHANLMKLFKLTDVQATRDSGNAPADLRGARAAKDRGRIKRKESAHRRAYAHFEEPREDRRASSKRKYAN